jgi:DNA repair protein RadC
MTGSHDVYEYFRAAHLSPQENLYVLMLDNGGTPLGHVLVSRGTQTQALVNPADALRPAVIAGAVRMVAVHNHPSGDPTPSKADMESTRRLSAAGKEVGVELLDHVVVGRDGYASLRDMGLFHG